MQLEKTKEEPDHTHNGTTTLKQKQEFEILQMSGEGSSACSKYVEWADSLTIAETECSTHSLYWLLFT